MIKNLFIPVKLRILSQNLSICFSQASQPNIATLARVLLGDLHEAIIKRNLIGVLCIFTIAYMNGNS